MRYDNAACKTETAIGYESVGGSTGQKIKRNGF